MVDLAKEGIDVSLGVRLEPRPGLIAKRISRSRLVAAASPDFIERHGAPEHPADLLDVPCIRYRAPGASGLFPWRFADPADGSSFVVDPPPAISASGQDLVADLAAAHQGVALLGLISAQPYLERGALVEVLGAYSYELPPLNLFFTSKANLPPRVRVFIDFVSTRLVDDSVEP